MKIKRSDIRLFLEFVMIPIFIWMSVVFFSFIYGCALTFTDWNGMALNYKFVGFENYINLLHDSTFVDSLFKTIIYAFFVIIFSNTIGLMLALLLTGRIKLRGVWRTCFFASNIVGGIVMGYIWQYIFNFAITNLGEITGIGLFKNSWLTNPTTALAALIIVTVWQMSGYLMVIYIAGLTSISNEYLEAALIDGASKWQMFRYVKLPMIRSSITICLFLTISRAFMSFDVNLALTKGGPYKSTELLSYKIYQTAFSSFKFADGQAQAVVLFIFVATVSLIQVYFTRKGEA